jgi:hypothetical protein
MFTLNNPAPSKKANVAVDHLCHKRLTATSQVAAVPQQGPKIGLFSLCNAFAAAFELTEGAVLGIYCRCTSRVLGLLKL